MFVYIFNDCVIEKNKDHTDIALNRRDNINEAVCISELTGDDFPVTEYRST